MFIFYIQITASRDHEYFEMGRYYPVRRMDKYKENKLDYVLIPSSKIS